MTYKPPFELNSKIFNLSRDISRELGVLSDVQFSLTPLKMRKKNNIKTIQSSLAIEGNTLSINQVTDVFDGKRVLGPEKDILEVKNAINVYKDLKKYDALSPMDLLAAHGVLMSGLVNNPGKWRQGAVGIYKGDQVAHIAPPAKRVAYLMRNLFEFIDEEKAVPWLIKACIFHYEFEFIHPFDDGNGRIGRLWQQLLLMKEDPIFEYISVEELIKENQHRYYDVLGLSDRAGESTLFIEFSLELILQALKSYSKESISVVVDVNVRLQYAGGHFDKEWFSRKSYMELHPSISTSTASRDLRQGLEEGILEISGDKNQAKYRFIP